MILHGDCLDKLRELPDNSVDSLVTDPPAGISFMGKAWDSNKGGSGPWIVWMASVMAECKRVMKPGAHGFVWAIPRTSHWTASACENAGFEIRDVVTHLFGSGFPKSLDVSKAIDKAAGAERQVISTYEQPDIRNNRNADKTEDRIGSNRIDGEVQYQTINVTAPSTDAAKQWQGWGTALKPASEHWILIRKPLGEKTVSSNVLKHGTGAINIDASRVEASKDYGRSAANAQGTVNAHNGFEGKSFKIAERDAEYASPLGRFPANLILDEEAGAMLDEQSGTLKSGQPCGVKTSVGYEGGFGNGIPVTGFGDSGGASRFFYTAKASKRDRGEGNNHPTVKSQKLMQYLIRMITPPGGTVLDCFAGSGSTLVAAKALGFKFIGIEQDADYVAIAEKRLEAI